MEEVTLENLANRIETDTRLLKEHPENKKMLERRIAKTNEMIKKLYEKDENGKYIHSLLERNAIYGVVSESHGLNNERGDNFDFEQEN